MFINRPVPWSSDGDVRIRDGHRDEDLALSALWAAGVLVRRATWEEDFYTRTDCWVLVEATVLGVAITTRVAGTPGWEARRCADLMNGVVWLAIPWQTLDCGALTPQAARDALARAVSQARLAWATLCRGPRPYPGFWPIGVASSSREASHGSALANTPPPTMPGTDATVGLKRHD